MNSIWSEIRSAYQEDEFIYIDGYLTDDDMENGNVIAKVNVHTLEVIYNDERAKTDEYAQSIINETIKQYSNNTVEHCLNCEVDVAIERKFEVQKCPDCGEPILPCNMCTVNECSHCTLDKQILVDAVIDELRKNFEQGDYTVLDELLHLIPRGTLINALPEEEWSKHI